ncbi:MAG: hypothetical protein ACLPV4_03620 [Solirubrobacteraceae bacterium]
MSEKDEKREQEEQADVEGHRHYLNEEEAQEGDDTPDVEGHKHSTSPVRKHSTKHSTRRF